MAIGSPHRSGGWGLGGGHGGVLGGGLGGGLPHHWGSAPACLRVTLAGYAAAQAKNLPYRNDPSMSPREVLREVRRVGGALEALNVGTATHALRRTSTLRSRADGDDRAGFRVLSKAVARVAHQMPPQRVVESMATIMLRDGTADDNGPGLSVDGDDLKAFRELSKAVARVAHEMTPERVCHAMSTLGKLAERGIGIGGGGCGDAEVDAAAVRALCTAATRVSGDLTPGQAMGLLHSLWQLEDRGRGEVDPTAVQAFRTRVKNDIPGMTPTEVAKMLWRLGRQAAAGDVDHAAVHALCARVKKIAPDLTHGKLSSALWGMGELACSGVAVDCTAVQALSTEATRLAHDASPGFVAGTLVAFARLEQSWGGEREGDASAQSWRHQSFALPPEEQIWGGGKIMFDATVVDAVTSRERQEGPYTRYPCTYTLALDLKPSPGTTQRSLVPAVIGRRQRRR